ncbi:NAD(P)-dependent oxidoreductase [Bdellovibrionota bacterium FG-2]
MSEKILITGATGYLGCHLVRKLLALGNEVHCLARAHSSKDVLGTHENEVIWHIYDGTTESVTRACALIHPDVCYHLASLFLVSHKTADVLPLIESNILFSVQLAEALSLEGNGVLINLGSSWQNFNSRAYHPVALYAATKQAFQDVLDFYAQTKSLRALTLKLFDTYGPADPRRKVINLLRDAQFSGKLLEMTAGEQYIDPVYVDDVIRGFLQAREYLKTAVLSHERFCLSSGSPIQIKDLVELIQKLTHKSLPIEWGKLPYREREMFTPWDVAPILPGWIAQVSLEEGIKRVFSE